MKAQKSEHMPPRVLAERASSARGDLGDGAARVAGVLVEESKDKVRDLRCDGVQRVADQRQDYVDAGGGRKDFVEVRDTLVGCGQREEGLDQASQGDGVLPLEDSVGAIAQRIKSVEWCVTMRRFRRWTAVRRVLRWTPWSAYWP
jgi:hypothetical protein